MSLIQYHSARIINPGEFDNESFITREIEEGVSAIVGRLKNAKADMMISQAYRFDKALFSPDEARAWLKRKEITVVEFLPAKEEVKPELKIESALEMKAGARHSTRDMELINTAHRKIREVAQHLRDLGAMSKPGYKADDGVPEEWT